MLTYGCKYIMFLCVCLSDFVYKKFVFWYFSFSLLAFQSDKPLVDESVSVDDEKTQIGFLLPSVDATEESKIR